MRIGIDVRKEWDGGIGRYIRNLMEGLLKSEEVTELHAWAKPDSGILRRGERKLISDAENAGLYRIYEQISLRKKVHQASVDLFHSPHYIVPFSLRIPLIVTVHDIIHLVFPKNFLHQWFARMQIGYAVRSARVIITPSAFSKNELARYFPGAEGKTIPILHGLEPAFSPNPIEGEAEIKQKLNLPERYLFYVGNHKSHKNLGSLLEICREIFREDKEVVLCVTGEKEDEGGSLYKTAVRLGVEQRLRFLGTLENDALRVFYRNALCFIFPSLYEGFGFPPLEAMACGTPVVAFRVASLPEVVGEGGILVPKGDMKGFYEAIQTLLKEDGMRRTWMEKGLNQAKKFKWDDAIEKHVKVYKKALMPRSV